MAITKKLPQDVLESVAQQIGTRLGLPSHTSNLEASLAPPGLDLGETFEVWSLPPDALEEIANGIELSTVARQTGLWHHQIRSNQQARTFARSKPLGATPDSWSLRGLFVSSLAEQMSAAIDWIETNVPANVEARYLSLPSRQLDAFWLVAEPNSPEFYDWNDKIVVIRAGASSALNSLEVMSSEELLQVLLEEDRGGGLR